MGCEDEPTPRRVCYTEMQGVIACVFPSGPICGACIFPSSGEESAGEH